MSKKRSKKNKNAKRVKGHAREELVLGIVRSDMTFEFHRDDSQLSTTGGGIWIGKCIHCGRKLGVSANGKTDATVEHIRPLCAGGSRDDIMNCALACKRCNNEKGVRHDEHVGKGGRADEVITSIEGKRLARWRTPETS